MAEKLEGWILLAMLKRFEQAAREYPSPALPLYVDIEAQGKRITGWRGCIRRSENEWDYSRQLFTSETAARMWSVETVEEIIAKGK